MWQWDAHWRSKSKPVCGSGKPAMTLRSGLEASTRLVPVYCSQQVALSMEAPVNGGIQAAGDELTLGQVEGKAYLASSACKAAQRTADLLVGTCEEDVVEAGKTQLGRCAAGPAQQAACKEGCRARAKSKGLVGLLAARLPLK